jgi:hypothetical protein
MASLSHSVSSDRQHEQDVAYESSGASPKVRSVGMNHEVYALQRAAGNRAAAQILQPRSGSSPIGRTDEPSIAHSVVGSSGQSLDPATRTLMESRFGQEFGHVRVHVDSLAANAARDVDALAFTVGHHIVFGAGAYMPSTSHGQRLVAHELVHVLQQQHADQKVPDHSGLVPVLDDPSLEREATALGTNSALGETAGSQVSGRVSGGLAAQREPEKPDTSSTGAKDYETLLREARGKPPPKLAAFPERSFRDLNHLPFDEFQQVLEAASGRIGPSVVVVHPDVGKLQQWQREIYKPKAYFVWTEDNNVTGWMPAEDVPERATRLGDWWIWRKGIEIQVCRRYPEDEASNRRGLGLEPDLRSIKDRVWAAQVLNRDIDYFLADGESIERARKLTYEVERDVVQQLGQAYFQTFAAQAEYQGNEEAIVAMGEQFGRQLTKIKGKLNLDAVSEAGQLAGGATAGNKPPTVLAPPTSGSTPPIKSGGTPPGGEQPVSPPKTGATPAKTPPASPGNPRASVRSSETKRIGGARGPRVLDTATREFETLNKGSEENRVGAALDRDAQSGRIEGIRRVRGLDVVPGSKSPDYHVTDSKGNTTTADLFQPKSSNLASVETNIIESKSGQAKIAIVELYRGDSKQIGISGAKSLGIKVVNHPSSSIERVIVIKDGQVIADTKRFP